MTNFLCSTLDLTNFDDKLATRNDVNLLNQRVCKQTAYRTALYAHQRAFLVRNRGALAREEKNDEADADPSQVQQ